jgi:hypothetical protein
VVTVQLCFRIFLQEGPRRQRDWLSEFNQLASVTVLSTIRGDANLLTRGLQQQAVFSVSFITSFK